jgi:hypothetical protein
MTFPPGVGLRSTTRDYQGLFRRWGAKANLRGVWNVATPVVVTDRYRGDDEGALRGLTAESLSAPNEAPAVFFGAFPDVTGDITADQEIHQVSVMANVPNAGALQSVRVEVHIFSPIAPYNPVLNPNPLGVFIPGLQTDFAFTSGRVIAVGGSNPLSAPNFGYQFIDRSLGVSSSSNLNWVNMNRGEDPYYFDPPIRLPAGQGMAIQAVPTFLAGTILRIRVAILYNERDNSGHQVTRAPP